MDCLKGIANKICRAVESKAGEYLQFSNVGQNWMMNVATAVDKFSLV